MTTQRVRKLLPPFGTATNAPTLPGGDRGYNRDDTAPPSAVPQDISPQKIVVIGAFQRADGAAARVIAPMPPAGAE